MVGQQITLYVRVVGRVQGVGFRWWTHGVATGLELRGWVRNESDGSVQLQAAGPAEAIATLRRRLERGPPAARVERVHELPGPYDLPDEGFEIRRG